MFRRLIMPLVLALSLAVPSVALAAQAQDFMKDKHAELTTLVKQNQDKKLEAMFDEVLDYDALGEGLAPATSGTHVPPKNARNSSSS